MELLFILLGLVGLVLVGVILYFLKKWMSDDTSITLVVESDRHNLHFSTRVPYVPGQNLLHYLQQAASTDRRFRNSTSIHPEYGALVQEIHGVANADPYYWAIEKRNGTQIDQGVSFYVPGAGELLRFSYQKG